MASIKISGIGSGDSSFTANVTSTATIGDATSDRIILNGTSTTAVNVSSNSVSSNSIIHTPTNTIITPFVASTAANTAVGANTISVTGIPSWATTISMCWNNLVGDTTAIARIRIGTGGIVISSAVYNHSTTNSGAVTNGSATNDQDGMSRQSFDLGTGISGWAILQKIPSENDSTSSTYGDTWIVTSSGYQTSSAAVVINWNSGVLTSINGNKNLTPANGAVLDTVGIALTAGAFSTTTGTLRAFWE